MEWALGTQPPSMTCHTNTEDTVYTLAIHSADLSCHNTRQEAASTCLWFVQRWKRCFWLRRKHGRCPCRNQVGFCESQPMGNLSQQPPSGDHEQAPCPWSPKRPSTLRLAKQLPRR